VLVRAVAGACAAVAGASAVGAADLSEGATARRLDGARLVRISGLTGSIQNPCWSPDGQRLAITLWPQRYNEGTASVHVVARGGGAPLAQVSAPGATSVNLPGTCWDRTSDLITFSAEADAPDSVFAAGPAGDRRARIFGRDGLVSIEPSWSPDGRRVVFESSVYDAEGPGTIWVVNADGAGLRQLTRGADDRQPNWSPAGDRIVFQRTRSGAQDLYTIRPDGTGLRNVTKTRRLSETDASWSPSGRKIVFSGDGPEIDVAALYAIPAAGGKRVRVTRTRGWYDGAPAWSPDGKSIAFEARRGEPDGSSGTRIYVVKAPRE
jgi:TolB protein